MTAFHYFTYKVKSTPIWCAILFLAGMNLLFAQAQLEAKVSKTSLPFNDKLRIDFEMNFDGDHFEAPNFEGFKVYSGPSQTVSQSWINGKGSFKKIYSYILAPTRKGKITIKSASVDYNGQTFKSNPISIEVTNEVERPRDPNDFQIDLNDELQLVAEVSNTSPYLNQPITVVYKLYFGYNIQIENWRELDKPKYPNFWSQHIDIKQLQAEEGTYQGKRTRYVVLRKTILYPQKDGSLEIEPLTLEFDVLVPTNKRDFWGRVLLERDTKKVTTGKRNISVKSLPNSAPIEFDGAVGNLQFLTEITKKDVQTGESLELIVKAKGNGNLKLFKLPKLKVPNAIEMYDPVFQEKVETTLQGMQGEILDRYTLVPTSSGNFVIQPLTFVYFDLASKSYKTITSQPIEIKVTQGSGTIAAVSNNQSKQPVVTSEQFRFIHTATKLTPTNQPEFIDSWKFYSALVGPFLLIPLFLFIRKRKENLAADVVGNRRREKERLAKKYLSEAQKSMQNTSMFYEALERSLHNFLKAKLKVETTDLSKANLELLLQERQVLAETQQSFFKLMQNCEMARYASFSNNDVANDYQQAVQCISNMEKQIKSS